MLKKSLTETGVGTMKCFGSSMLPILPNPSTCDYERSVEYKIGDIVFCKVNGRYIDAHKITKKDGERYLISNNHGHDNGWTRIIYGRVIQAKDKHGTLTYEHKEKAGS
jgi:phage repressor protein C with HTH and peptisase S24 domain